MTPNILFLNRHLDRLDARRSVRANTLLRAKDTAEEDLIWCAQGEPVSIPIRSPQADAALAAIAGHEATHAARTAEYQRIFARSNVPPSQLTEAEIETILPPRRFACYEVGGRPADDMPMLLTKRGVFTAGGVVLLLAVGWLGGVISAVMVL